MAPQQRPSSLSRSVELYKRIQRVAKGAPNLHRRKKIELLIAFAMSKLLANIRAQAIASGKQLPGEWPRLKKQDFVPAICAEPTPNDTSLASRFAFMQLREHLGGKLLAAAADACSCDLLH